MNHRRTFIRQTAAAASALAFPLVGGAQPKAVKVGILHPVTGALAFSGQQCREGAMMAIEDINKAGIKSWAAPSWRCCSATRRARRRPAPPRSRR
jgi:hypothetical protein